MYTRNLASTYETTLSTSASHPYCQGLVGVSYTLDLVPPHLVSTIVTNTHIVSPGQVPWLLRETFGAAV